MEYALFGFFSLCALAAALCVVTCREPLPGALALVVVTLATAGLCALAGAPVLGAAALLLLGSAALVYALFAAALRTALPAGNYRAWLPYGAVFFAVLLAAQLLAHVKAAGAGGAAVAAGKEVAQALFGELVLPVHIVALTLLCAVVTALSATRARAGTGEDKEV